jgi:magnesium transporter
MPKLDEFDDHLFLVLHFPRFDKQSRITHPSEVDVFAGAGYIVTVHSGDLRPLVKLFSDCQASEEVRADLMGRGSGYLLYRVLDSLVDDNFPILRKIIANVDGLEERVFETIGQEVVRELALLRRDVLSYRRVVRPQI